jgi:uncharacterized protein with HEPN domain
MRDERIYLEYIRESIVPVGQYTQDGEATFYADSRTQDAVLRRMETLADAATHLSPELRARHPEVPWRQVADFRNVLAHAYAEIRLDRVWSAIVHDLPALKSVVDEELGRSSSS